MKLKGKIIFNIIQNIDNIDKLNLSDKEKIKYLVTMHDVGLIRYTLLNPANYYYWWYEVTGQHEIDKNKFTPCLKNFKLTFKGEMFKKRFDVSIAWNILLTDIENNIENLRVNNWTLFKKSNESVQTYLA